MLQIESQIIFKDNCGIINGKIIHIYKSGKKKNTGRLTDIFLFSPQKVKNRKNINQKTYYGIITNTRKKNKRINGHYINSAFSSAVSLQQKDIFKATRVTGTIFSEIRFAKLPTLILTAKKII